MMKIDLKWGLPFVMPFVLLMMVRLVWVAAGAEWSDPEGAAFCTIVSGFVVGVCAAGFMHDEGVHWTVRIGPRKDTP